MGVPLSLPRFLSNAWGPPQKTQIWITVSVYVLIAIVRKRLRLEVSPYTSLQVFSVTVFEKIPTQSAILASPDRFDDATDSNQSELFTFRLDNSDNAFLT